MAIDLKESKNKNGIYIRGDVISNSAKIVKMKDTLYFQHNLQILMIL